jgi:hypothetical protein
LVDAIEELVDGGDGICGKVRAHNGNVLLFYRIQNDPSKFP